MQAIYERVSNWNAARYEREYNIELAVKLLEAEYNEWAAATELADCAHELCDIIYVALGCIWKLDDGFASHSEVTTALRCVDAMVDVVNMPANFIWALVQELRITEQPKLTLLVIIMLVQAQMFAMGLTDEESEACMLALCNSNDSKSVKKTASDVKANSGDRGVYYVSPKPAITAIVEAANERRKNLN